LARVSLLSSSSLLLLLLLLLLLVAHVLLRTLLNIQAPTLRLHKQADGTCILETDNVWVLPRKELAA
jgi:hypothetical protein